MVNRPSAAVLAAMKDRKPNTDTTTLEKLKKRAADVRSLDMEIASLEERLEEKKKDKNKIVTKELPDMMSSVGVPSFEIEADGNEPAYVVKSQPYYHANIKADWPEEQRAAAFALLKEMGAPDMLKTIIEVELGRGSAKIAAKVKAALRKLKVPFDESRGVPYGTLTAFVRELYEKNESLTSKQKEILGATVGTLVSVKPKVDRKSRNTKEKL